MKIKTLLQPLALTLLFALQSFVLTAQCTDYVYDELIIANDWSVCHKKFLTKTINITFPTDKILVPDLNIWVQLEVDLNDGQGYNDVPSTLTTTVTYGSTGGKLLRFRACIIGPLGCFYETIVPIRLTETSHDYYSPDQILDLSVPDGVSWMPPTDCTPYADNSDGYLDGTIGGGKAYIKYAPGNSALIKPIIFIDGLDFTGKKIVRDNAIGGGEIIRYGSTGWDVVVTGSSEGFTSQHANFPKSEFDLYPQAFDELYDEGFDIVFIDFERGADYIQKNGLLLIEAIKMLNNLKQVDPATGNKNQNIIAGASMGGQISRWALATMELSGDCHETSTYISFDSPHKGANIPLALQAAAWYAFNTGDDTNLWGKLNRPATRQLLVEHFGDAMQDGKLIANPWTPGSDAYSIETDFSYGCLREGYVAEMNSLGYPNTRNIAISCGSGQGVDQGYDEDDLLYFGRHKLNIPGTSISFGTVFRSGIWALNGGATSGTWDLKYSAPLCGVSGHWILPSEDDYLFVLAKPDNSIFLDCTTQLPYGYQSVAVRNTHNFPHYDNAPGCYRYDLFDFGEAIDDELDSQPGTNLSFLVPDRYQQTFMPTMSTLDVNWQMTTTNMWRNLSNENIIANGLTPFEAYYAPAGNIKHVEMDQGMIDWIIDQVTISEDVVIDELPNANGTAYNYGIEGQNQILGVNINDGGILRVNDLGETGYIPNLPEGELTEMSTFTAYTAGCESDIVINSGGEFILGNDLGPNGNRNAIVHVRKGHTVHVKDGGILRLARGSQLIIEPGAKLIIDDGARVDLWWSESTIHIKGKGELEINGDFTFIGSGFFQFDPENLLTLNADFNLVGQYDRFMQLNSDATLDIGDMGLNLERGTVELRDGSEIRVGPGGEVRTNRVTFTNYGTTNALTTAVALQLENPAVVDLFFTSFENLSSGIEISSFDGTQSFLVNYCFFDNNTFGLLAFEGNQVTVKSSRFRALDEGAGGIYAYDVADIDVTGTTMQGYDSPGVAALDLTNVGDAYIGGTVFQDNRNAVKLIDVPSYRMNGGRIELTNVNESNDGTIGIYAPYDALNYTNIFLRENAIIRNQEVGIKVVKGGEFPWTNVLYGKVLMDCAKLINNGVGIEGEDVTLEIDAFVHCNCNNLDDAKPNTFIRSPWTTAQEKHFNICYRDLTPPSPILAQGNYWEGGSNNASYSLTQTGIEQACGEGTNIPLLNAIQATEEPSSCSGDDVIKITRDANDDDPTDLERETTEMPSLLVYPNPTENQFTIQLNKENYTIRIYDVLGKIVFEQKGMPQSRSLNSIDWPKGIYMIEAIDELTKTRLQTKLVTQ